MKLWPQHWFWRSAFVIVAVSLAAAPVLAWMYPQVRSPSHGRIAAIAIEDAIRDYVRIHPQVKGLVVADSFLAPFVAERLAGSGLLIRIWGDRGLLLQGASGRTRTCKDEETGKELVEIRTQYSIRSRIGAWAKVEYPGGGAEYYLTRCWGRLGDWKIARKEPFPEGMSSFR